MGFVLEAVYRQMGRVPLVLHRHADGDSIELIQVWSGGGSALIGGQSYPLTPGTLLFIDAAEIHALNPQQEAQYCRNKLILCKSAFLHVLQTVDGTRLFDVFAGGGACFFPSPPTADRIDRVFFAAAQPSPVQNGTALDAALQLIQLAAPQTKVAPSEPDARIRIALEYLNAHYREPLTIARIASETLLSKYYLCHLFHANTGMTVMQYLLEQRLRSARRMLTQTDCTIAEIAQECGFGSSSHFCTVFGEREGVSPRNYRAAARRKG